jgi:V/A-type H+-transporting ATPase subunit D
VPRVPPGKAARPWLLRSLEVARRAGELLDEKRVALLREHEALRRAAAAHRAELEAVLDASERWWEQAALVGGRRGARLVTADVPPARIAVTWATAVGVTHPVARLETADAHVPALVGAGGGALRAAAAGYAGALRLAAATAQAEAAERAVAAELARTTRRLRAIEWRWIPQHETALAALELALDEAERAEGTRVRWAVQARGAGAAAIARERRGS